MDKTAIDRCDIVIALDFGFSADSGTAWEIGYAFAKYKKVAAICAAPTILGKLGFLKNKKYTCFPPLNEDFGGNYIDRYVVKDNNLITGKSAAATIDFAFAIVEELLGKNYAESIKNSIYYYNR